MRIGFEFEVLTIKDDSQIEDDLERMFGKKAQDFTVTTDCTIRRDRSSRKKDGWFAWEIITPPQKKKKALQTLSDIQSYLSEIDTVTNVSTGFHVNISAKRMKEFDPMTLIAVVDEHRVAQTFNRADNPYCVPWAYHFDRISKRVKRNPEILDKKHSLMYNSTSLVDCVAQNDSELLEDMTYSVFRDLDEKYITINISKLQLGYVEFRMMGGKDYHEKDLKSIVLELADSVKFAAQGKNEGVIEQYFEQY